VGPRAGLDVLENRKIQVPAENRSAYTNGDLFRIHMFGQSLCSVFNNAVPVE
jgi:hypothetical protein